MHLTQNKVNSQKVASLRAEIFAISSSIAKYAGNKRVEKKLVNNAFQPVVPSPKEQADRAIHMKVKPSLIDAASRAREIGNLAKCEHDVQALRSYKKELVSLHKAIDAVAPKSEFGKHKLD